MFRRPSKESKVHLRKFLYQKLIYDRSLRIHNEASYRNLILREPFCNLGKALELALDRRFNQTAPVCNSLASPGIKSTYILQPHEGPSVTGISMEGVKDYSMLQPHEGPSVTMRLCRIAFDLHASTPRGSICNRPRLPTNQHPPGASTPRGSICNARRAPGVSRTRRRSDPPRTEARHRVGPRHDTRLLS